MISGVRATHVELSSVCREARRTAWMEREQGVSPARRRVRLRGVTEVRVRGVTEVELRPSERTQKEVQVVLGAGPGLGEGVCGAGGRRESMRTAGLGERVCGTGARREEEERGGAERRGASGVQVGARAGRGRDTGWIRMGEDGRRWWSRRACMSRR